MSMDHPWMDTLPPSLCPSIHECHGYSVHPWTVYGWTPCWEVVKPGTMEMEMEIHLSHTHSL